MSLFSSFVMALVISLHNACFVQLSDAALLGSKIVTALFPQYLVLRLFCLLNYCYPYENGESRKPIKNNHLKVIFAYLFYSLNCDTFHVTFVYIYVSLLLSRKMLKPRALTQVLAQANSDNVLSTL